MPTEGRPRQSDRSDDPWSTGPLTVSDLLAKSGQPPVRSSRRRVAARQAVVQVSRHRVRRTLAVVMTVLVALLASTAAYYVGLFFYLDGAIDRVDALAEDSPGIISPEAQDAADNYLIVGTEADGSAERVTSAVVAHLGPGRDGAVLVSLPLTAFVDVPACPRGAQSRLTDPYGGSLASSYAAGGAGCLVRSVQQLTGMRINHYVQLDLGRLPGMVDALGGVPVCIPPEMMSDELMSDEMVGDETGDQPAVPAGASVLDADQVRALLADVDPDLDPTGQKATDRQRLLLASTLREALRVANLANPIVLTGFISEVANSLTLDPGTTLGALKDLGDKLGEFTAGDTVQASVPLAQVRYQPVGSEQSFALIDDQASREMFLAIIGDSDLPAIPPGPDSSPAPDPGTPPDDSAPPPLPPPDPNALTVAPAQITVNVFNGIGTPGLATNAAAELTAQGFRVGEIENQVTGAVESVVRYAPEQFQAARTVAAAVPNSVLQEGATAGGFIDLIVGSSFDGAVPVVIPAPPPAATTAAPVPTATTTTGSERLQSCD